MDQLQVSWLADRRTGQIQIWSVWVKSPDDSGLPDNFVHMVWSLLNRRQPLPFPIYQMVNSFGSQFQEQTQFFITYFDDESPSQNLKLVPEKEMGDQVSSFKLAQTPFFHWSHEERCINDCVYFSPLSYDLYPRTCSCANLDCQWKGRVSGNSSCYESNGIPTLIYNCAKLPANCSNVHQRNKLQVIPPGEPGQYGKLQGVNHIELNFDTDQTRKDGRRNAICPCSWKSSHPCPEKNQPVTVPAGGCFSKKSYAAARLNQPNVKMGDSGYNTIANQFGTVSGMVWTCDEWPPASYDHISS